MKSRTPWLTPCSGQKSDPIQDGDTCPSSSNSPRGELPFEVLTTSDLSGFSPLRGPLRNEGFSSEPEAPTTNHS